MVRGVLLFLALLLAAVAVAVAQQKPLPMDACVGMMEEATSHERLALSAIRASAMEEASSQTVQSTSLMQAAFKCAMATDMLPATIAPFDKAKDEWQTQHAIVEAAMSAKLKSMGIDPASVGLPN